MNIPERVNVQVCLKSGEPVADLIVQMTVRAGDKNPYHIEFPKTDRSGTASLRREEFIGQFRDHWDAGLMDHNGTPESAHPEVEVCLYDPTPLILDPQLSHAWPLLTYERTRWSSRLQRYDYRVSSRNRAFSLEPVRVNIEDTPHISLVVEPK